MSTTSLVKDLVEITLPLASIYLDPNNPRFVAQDSPYIPDNKTTDKSIQDDTQLRLIRDFAVERLKMNMEINGFLPIDRVIVRELGKEKFIVLEGNRRICAAKLITQSAADGMDVPPEILDSLEKIPCLQYVGGEKNAAWIFQGLRHITGISDWSSFNKAKLLVEQMEEDELGLTEVGRRFGLTPFGAGQWVRGYYAFKQAREESDFINEVDERAYPYLQEVFSRSSAVIRDWMNWDDDERKFRNALNFNEFMSWLYPRGASNDIDDSEERESEKRGDFERRALRRGNDIRQIAFLLREDKQAFEKFRRELDVEQAYSEAMARLYEREVRETVDQTEEVFKTISECTNALDNVPHKMLKNAAAKTKLIQALEKLEKTISELKQ